MSGTVLVAGVGNIFLRDDGFGVEVASRLATRPMPEGVRVVDFGIRGLHLAYELLDGYDALVLVDAMPMGEPPGTVAVVEPDIDVTGSDVVAVDAHGMDPATVLATLSGLGGSVGRVLRRRVRAGRPGRRHRSLVDSRRRRRPRRRRRRVPAGRHLLGRRKREPLMIRRLAVFAGLVLLAAVIKQALPDIRRYLKMRGM